MINSENLLEHSDQIDWIQGRGRFSECYLGKEKVIIKKSGKALNLLLKGNFIRSGPRLLNVSRIEKIEIGRNSCFIFIGGITIRDYRSFDKLEKVISADQWLRVSRYFVVPLRCVVEHNKERKSVLLTSGEELPFGSTYWHQLYPKRFRTKFIPELVQKEVLRTGLIREAAKSIGTRPETLSRFISREMPDLQYGSGRPPLKSKLRREVGPKTLALLEKIKEAADIGMTLTDLSQECGCSAAYLSEIRLRYLPYLSDQVREATVAREERVRAMLAKRMSRVKIAEEEGISYKTLCAFVTKFIYPHQVESQTKRSTEPCA